MSYNGVIVKQKTEPKMFNPTDIETAVKEALAKLAAIKDTEDSVIFDNDINTVYVLFGAEVLTTVGGGKVTAINGDFVSDFVEEVDKILSTYGIFGTDWFFNESDMQILHGVLK